MDSSSVPCVDLTKYPETLEEGSKRWRLTVQEMKEALDTHGYFLVKYDAISKDDREGLLEAIHSVFDLPLETKRGSSSYEEKFPRYLGTSSFLPLYELMRAGNAADKETAEAFTRLMWPNGNDNFCNYVHSMGAKMATLTRVLISMILHAYGLGRHQETIADACEVDFHIMKYSTPEKGGQALGIAAHADTNCLTVLGQNDVSGLTIKNNQGDWVEVDPGQSSFVVFVGQALRAFTNGRLQAAFHQVTMSGAKERLSYAAFLRPKPDLIVEALPEMVDEEHPRLFRPVAYHELFKSSLQGGGDVLSRVAGM